VGRRTHPLKKSGRYCEAIACERDRECFENVEMSDPLYVMVIDDDPVVLEVTCALLESMGYATTTRSQGLGTSSAVLSIKPDIVLLDVGLPGLGGDQLVDLIQDNRWDPDEPWPAVILYSGMDIIELEQLAKKTGARGSIQKTSMPEAFKANFRRVVGSISG
jgi:CheY-like chemotaxis protein